MRKMNLGTSDLQVPVVAVGFWRLNRNTDLKTAEEFIRAYYKNIVEKWMNFFVLKKRVRCTQITKKVK